MSESEEKLCQEILTDLLGSLLILLSGEPNRIFDQHIQIIQQFLTQVMILNTIYTNTRQYLDIFLRGRGLKSTFLYHTSCPNWCFPGKSPQIKTQIILC